LATLLATLKLVVDQEGLAAMHKVARDGKVANCVDNFSYRVRNRCKRTRFKANLAVRLWISRRVPSQLNFTTSTPVSWAKAA
jgi:hypothetical protein